MAGLVQSPCAIQNCARKKQGNCRVAGHSRGEEEENAQRNESSRAIMQVAHTACIRLNQTARGQECPRQTGRGESQRPSVASSMHG